MGGVCKGDIEGDIASQGGPRSIQQVEKIGINRVPFLDFKEV